MSLSEAEDRGKGGIYFHISRNKQNPTFPDSIEEGFVELVSISIPVAVPPCQIPLLVPLPQNTPCQSGVSLFSYLYAAMHPRGHERDRPLLKRQQQHSLCLLFCFHRSELFRLFSVSS